MKNSSLASGDKAVRATPGSFRKGANLGTGDVDATKRMLPKGSYQGSSNQPLNKGEHRINFHPQPVPKIPKSSQMGSGT